VPPAERVRLVKLAGEQRYLARSRSVEPGAYYELRVSPAGHVRCTCPGFGYRGRCAHAEALSLKLGGPPPEDTLSRIRRNHA
jgi:uncharacterized Zn finger protein